MSDVQSILDDLGRDELPAAQVEQREVVVDRTGVPRQAGASTPEGEYIRKFRLTCERSLYAFAVGVLGRGYLTKKLHRPTCDWLQQCPPRRKLLLMPRETGKTTIVGHALPIHILIQPVEHNIYYPGLDGSDMTIVLSGETLPRATDALRVIQSIYESNKLMHALWPHRCWDNPRRDSKKWNEAEIVVRHDHRTDELPDPSIRAIGVGGAITGAHPKVLIKDDLVTLEAANSPTTMLGAIDWHSASRALINDDLALEFIIGTRWAVTDLYSYIMENDPTVQVMIRALVEDGVIIYHKDDLLPEYKQKGFDADKVAATRIQHKTRFPLMYMNSATDPELTDFDLAMLREYKIDGDSLVTPDDPRDAILAERMNAPVGGAGKQMQYVRLHDVPHDALFTRGEYYRAKPE